MRGAPNDFGVLLNGYEKLSNPAPSGQGQSSIFALGDVRAVRVARQVARSQSGDKSPHSIVDTLLADGGYRDTLKSCNHSASVGTAIRRGRGGWTYRCRASRVGLLLADSRTGWR